MKTVGIVVATVVATLTVLTIAIPPIGGYLVLLLFSLVGAKF